MIAVEPYTLPDAVYVWRHLWERGKAELALLGRSSPSEIMRFFTKHLGDEFAYTVKIDDVPLIVMGAEKDEGCFATWFMATEEFDAHGKEATKAVRRFLAAKKADHPDKELVIFSLSQHPASDKWFRLLGFGLVAQEGGVRVYKYHS